MHDDVRVGVLENIAKMRDITIPTLILHGSDDKLVPPEQAQLLYKSSGARRKHVVMLQGHGHNDVSFAEQYWTSIFEFLDQDVFLSTLAAARPQQ